jgi:O-succinylbenzoate synthase
MRVEAVELRWIEMPLVLPFRTSFGVQTGRDVLLVRVRAADTEGWGECSAMSVPSYSSEYGNGAHYVIKEFLLPRIFAAGDIRADEVGRMLAGVRGHPMAKTAVEAAILDAELRASGMSFATRLGATRDRIECGVSIGIPASMAELLDQVAGYIDAGYMRIKLKIEPGWDVEPVRAVRERFPDALLQVDANAAYSLADADALAALDSFDLLLVEQPLPEDDLLGHAELAKRITTPICLDETITSVRITEAAIAMGACSIVNIKAARIGGYLEAVEVHDLCLSKMVPVWCGGMLETGIGRAANVALAALPGFTLPGDTSASDRYFARDITPPFVMEDGHLTVPTAAGLGVTPVMDVLNAVTTSVEEVRPD